MTTKQPEALRLADLLEHIRPPVAAELRRLHAENERLKKIEEKHAKLNGELREELKQVAAAEREQMISEGWRQCAIGQKTTQFCGLADIAVQAEREKCLQQIEIIVEAEREMCARIVENAEIVTRWHGYSEFDDGPKTLWNAAAAIRARGQK